jgi:hypothetical protein
LSRGERRQRIIPHTARCDSRTAGVRASYRKPLDTLDKRISRVLLAAALGPQPGAGFGPSDAFVVMS